MAAWILVGLAIGLVVGGGAMWVVGEGARVELAVARLSRNRAEGSSTGGQADGGDGGVTERVLDRLLDAVVPKHVEVAGILEEPPGSAGEYEPPEEPVGDWTDPFIGLERPLVARLAPGQQIAPGIPRDDLDDGGADPIETWREAGAGAFDEWARDSMMPDGMQEAVLEDE